MGGIGVVLNPHSKKYKNNPDKLKHMAFIVGDKGSFAPTQDVQDIRRVAEDFKRKNIEILALSGGDGTNHLTLTHFIEVYGDTPLPKIALLRGGTLNTIAYSCGIRGTSEKLLTNLLYKYHQDESFEIKELDMMNVNGQYGFLWGCGVIYNFMEAYYKDGIPSPTQAVWTLAKSIGSALINGPLACKMFERFEAEVVVDGEVWPFKNYSAIYTGSVPYIGLGFKVFHLLEKPRQFHAIGFSMPPRSILPYVPMMFLGKPSHSPDLIEKAVSEMKIILKEPKAFMIDGDMYPPVDQFVIKPGPRLQIIVLKTPWTNLGE